MPASCDAPARPRPPGRTCCARSLTATAVSDNAWIAADAAYAQVSVIGTDFLDVPAMRAYLLRGAFTVAFLAGVALLLRRQAGRRPGARARAALTAGSLEVEHVDVSGRPDMPRRGGAADREERVLQRGHRRPVARRGQRRQL
jgi:hypothetical protein